MKFGLPFLMMLFPVLAFSQDKPDAKISDIFKVNFLSPGIGYEKAIGRMQSVYINPMINLGADFNHSDALGTEFNFYVDPSLNIQYRYYFNAGKRLAKGKRVAMNSLNYLGPSYTVNLSKQPVSDAYFTEDKRRPVHTAGIVWGLQRNFESRISLDLHLGAGYFFTTGTQQNASGALQKINVSGFTPLLGFSLGFWLNKTQPE